MAEKSNSRNNPASPKATQDKPDVGEFLPRQGERAVTIGQTGSGKTLFNRHLLERLEDSPTVIYDTKHDPKFEALKNSRVVTTMRGAQEAIDDLGVDYVILRPPPSISADPNMLDAILQYHEQAWWNVGAYIDELYHFHKGGRAGPGLNGLYTRGRSRGITTIGSTQRPAWVSGFIFSETQLFYVFQVFMDVDRKKIAGFIPDFDKLALPPRYHFHLYRQGGEAAPRLMNPVKVADEKELAYTDTTKLSLDNADAAESEESPDADKSGHDVNIWL